MYTIKEFKSYFYALLVIAMTSLLPFIGSTEFNTKGEPREAVVAYSMVETGNYVLPHNNGEEFAYKPPMLHWCIAAFSKVIGSINEYSSRLPSALSGIILALLTFCFFAKRKNVQIGFLTALIFLTTFEVHRASTNCRVDMLLTLFICWALFLFYRWIEKGMKTLPWFAIICMGLGTLTKGPVAIILPCMVSSVYLLFKLQFNHVQKKDYVWLFLRYLLIVLLAIVIPFIWYYAAYLQEGNKFLALVYEENVLRFLGKMSYDSHVHGPFYYVAMLAIGLLPYTILLLVSLPLAYIKRSREYFVWNKSWWIQKWTHFQKMDSVDQFSLVATILILLFFTIPKSKRSVYILSMYPFLSYYIAQLLVYLLKVRYKWIIYYTNFLRSILCLIVLPVILGVFLGQYIIPYIPEKYTQLVLSVVQYQSILLSGTIGIVLVISLVAIFYLLRKIQRPLADLMYTVIVTFILLDTIVLPPVLNNKSDKSCAVTLVQLIGKDKDNQLYSYLDDEGGMMHYFTLNFYSGNKIKVFQPTLQKGWLIVGENDLAVFKQKYPNYKMQLIKNFQHKSCDTKQNIMLFSFIKQ